MYRSHCCTARIDLLFLPVMKHKIGSLCTISVNLKSPRIKQTWFNFYAQFTTFGVDRCVARVYVIVASVTDGESCVAYEVPIRPIIDYSLNRQTDRQTDSQTDRQRFFLAALLNRVFPRFPVHAKKNLPQHVEFSLIASRKQCLI